MSCVTVRCLLVTFVLSASVHTAWATGTDLTAAQRTPVVSVLIDTQQHLGPAKAIGDLLGLQYAPYTFGPRNPDPWGIKAFTEIGFNVGDIALFNYEDISSPYTDAGKIVGIHVKRDKAGRLQLDFSDFDKNIKFMRNVLHVRRIDFTCWGTPKALADPAAGEFYFYHAPRSYAEWNDILARAVWHIAHVLKLPGSTYKPWTEPETGYYWRGRARPGFIVTRQTDPAKIRARLVKQRFILDDYLEKYVNDWRVIKATDPTAKVGGPFTVWSKAIPAHPEHLDWGLAFTLDDFLSGLDDYNAHHPGKPVGIDEIDYQDYDWTGHGLADGVIAANALVKKHHLPSNIPLVLMGWNQNLRTEPNHARRTAYVVSNIVRELIPVGRPRTLARAYLWPFDTDYQYKDPVAPVVMPYQATSYDGADGVGDGPFSVPAVHKRLKRPMHAALVMLARMEPGVLISAKSNDRAVPALASLQPDGRLLALMVNDSAQSKVLTVRILRQSGMSTRGTLKVQRADATHSADGSGLEAGTQEAIVVGSSGKFPAVAVPPWSVVGIIWRPDGN